MCDRKVLSGVSEMDASSGKKSFYHQTEKMCAYALSFTVLRHDQIHNNGSQENDRNAIFGKNGADDIGEDVKHFGNLGEAKADAQRKGCDGDIALGETAGTDHLQAGNDDIAELSGVFGIGAHRTVY